ncbi:MAG: hypothetical protein EA377_00080 [Phycisphaerales bacterium]|nr:MAG: hypothetical protein EA377_00080 [Phycisphaerales bacterium]
MESTNQMRCLSCNYDLSHRLPEGEQRCPECGRVFNPDDPRTWSTTTRRLWPRKAVFLPIMLGIWLVITSMFFIDGSLNLPQGASYLLLLAGTAASAFILTLLISLLLLTGFAFGRR